MAFRNPAAPPLPMRSRREPCARLHSGATQPRAPHHGQAICARGVGKNDGLAGVPVNFGRETLQPAE